MKQLRDSKGLTNQALADKTGYHRNTISNWMNGNTPPSRAELADLIKATRALAGCSDDEERFLLEAYAGFRLPPPLLNAPFARNDFFTGRKELLEQLHQHLATPQSRLDRMAAITGLAGVGKTHVALEYAHRYVREHSPMLWATADSRETLITEFCNLAQHLQLPEKDAKEQNRVVAAVQRWLREHPKWLLVLDNVEDLSVVGEFISPGWRGAVLLTTRLQPPIAQGFVLKTMTDDESAWFLLRRTDRLALDAPLTAAATDDDGEARAIAGALGGLPLALDQAGAYISQTQCTFATYLQLYETKRARLLGERGDVLWSRDHPESVVVTFSLTFERVQQKNPASVDMLRLCAFLAPDRIPEELFLNGSGLEGTVLEQIGSDQSAFNEAVGALYGYSLMQRNTDERTLSVHRLVQAVLQDGMDDQSQRTWAVRAIHAVAGALTACNVGELETWGDLDRLLPHALECRRHIHRYTIITVVAAGLLYRTGEWLSLHVTHREEAKRLCGEALAIFQLIEPYHPDTLMALRTLGLLCQFQGELAGAELFYERALAIYEHWLGRGHPNTAIQLVELARLCEAQDKLADAELFYKRAIAVYERALGPSHPDTAIQLVNQARLCSAQGKYREAERLYKRALAVYEQTFQHPDTAHALDRLAGLYEAQGKHREAERLYKRALAIYEQAFGPEHRFTKDLRTDCAKVLRETGRAIAFVNQARLYELQGKHTAAERLYKLAIDDQALQHPDTAHALHKLAALYELQGKHTAAERLYEQALAIYKQAFGPEHRFTKDLRTDYAKVLRETGRAEEASALERRWDKES